MNDYINRVSTEEISKIQQSFLTKVYGWMLAGLGISGITGWYAFQEQLALQLGGFLWLIVIAQIGFVFLISGMINKISSTTASFLFIVYSVLTGITLSVIGLVYSVESIIQVFFIAGGSFGALSLYGYTTKKDLSAMGSFMMMGLFGIIILAITNIFIGSGVISLVIGIIGVVVFAGLTAYDTQKLKEMSLEFAGDNELLAKGAIIGALALYLDFINLFLMLLRIFGNRD